MKPHIFRPSANAPAAPPPHGPSTASVGATKVVAPQVLLSLPDLRTPRPIPVATPPASRPTSASAVRAPAHASPEVATAKPRATSRSSWQRHKLRRRKLRVDSVNKPLLPAMSSVGDWARERFTRESIVEALQGRTIWAMALTALMVDVLAVMFLNQPAPAPTPAELPPIPTMPVLQGPTLQPSASPLPPTKPSAPLFPSNAPKLGDPDDKLPWESWTPREPSLPADSNESAANRPARLLPFDNTTPAAAETTPEYRTARVPQVAAPMTPRGADTPTGKARLLGTIRKPLPEVRDERARPGLY